jgi:hypothetical protein
MKNNEPLDSLLRRVSHADEDAAHRGACLDPETLAAWADGTLTGAEREAAETHAADCARCLAMVAAMATTAPPPSEAAERPAWSLIRWLVPLTTAAVAVTAWLVVRPAEPPEPVTAPATEMAETAKPAEAPPAVETSAERKETRQAQASTKAASPARREGERTATAAAPPSAAAPAAPAAALKDEQVQRFAGGPGPVVIVSPDPNVRWRLSGRTVERSVDGGATWQPPSTGAAADLIAGASPARDVVWIVGRAGTVLLSADGASWQRLAFPDVTADLVSVTASNARTATVTTSAGRTYTTTDGGRTWRLQEDRPAPF